MTDHESARSRANWSRPRFSFQVTWGDTVMSFQEVSGLDGLQAIEDRAGNSSPFSVIKLPGLRKNGNITLKRGVVRGDTQFFDWLNAIKTNTTARAVVTVALLDEHAAPVMMWTLRNAYPTKFTGPDLNGDGNDVAVETLEIAHEGLDIAHC